MVSRPDHLEPGEVPVDTLGPPHEPAVWTRSTRRFWAILLAGPVIWIVHFAVVYLAAETACTPAVADRWPALDESSLERFVVIATIIAALGCAAAAVVAWRSMRAPAASPLHRASVVLAIGSFASVIAVGGPVLVLDPC
jgi:heme/copper-type cytochrome/quinol oxidase subunit 2